MSKLVDLLIAIIVVATLVFSLKFIFGETLVNAVSAVATRE